MTISRELEITLAKEHRNINEYRDIPILEPPQIVNQAHDQGWKAGVFNFGRAKTDKVDFFNSGFITTPKGHFLITRRSVPENGSPVGFNDLVAFAVNGDHSPSHGQKVKVAAALPQEHFEDPRAMYLGDRLYVSACNFVLNTRANKWTGAHQVLLEVNDEWVASKRYDIPYGKNGDRMGGNSGMEKNWTWFYHQGAPHMVYSAQPKTVVRFTPDFEIDQQFITSSEAAWSYGEIRGGTPPIFNDGQYWTFFHSSVPWTNNKRRYFMGAYSFEARPPFRITSITPTPLLIGSWRDRWRTGCPLVVFPCGSELRNGTWLVTGGQNDLDTFWVEIPHESLVARMESNSAIQKLIRKVSI